MKKTMRAISTIIMIAMVISMTGITAFASFPNTIEERVSRLEEKYPIEIELKTSYTKKNEPETHESYEKMLTELENILDNYMGRAFLDKYVDIQKNYPVRDPDIPYKFDSTIDVLLWEVPENQGNYEDKNWSGYRTYGGAGNAAFGSEIVIEMRRGFIGTIIPTDLLAGFALGYNNVTECWKTADILRERTSYNPNGYDPNGDYISDYAREGKTGPLIYSEIFGWGVFYGGDKPCQYPKNNQIYMQAKTVYEDLIPYFGYNTIPVQRMAAYLGIKGSQKVAGNNVESADVGSAADISSIQTKFNKWYSNDLIVVNAVQGQNTVKTTIKNPVFTSYNEAANTVKTLTIQYTIKDGSIAFTSTSREVVVISEGKLAK